MLSYTLAWLTSHMGHANTSTFAGLPIRCTPMIQTLSAVLFWRWCVFRAVFTCRMYLTSAPAESSRFVGLETSAIGDRTEAVCSGAELMLAEPFMLFCQNPFSVSTMLMLCRGKELDADEEYDVDGGLDMYESRNKRGNQVWHRISAVPAFAANDSSLPCSASDSSLPVCEDPAHCWAENAHDSAVVYEKRDLVMLPVAIYCSNAAV